MRAPAFWWEPPGFPADLAAPFAWLYGQVAGRRLAKGGVQVDVPVICIGNPTLGGAGKTPAALAVAGLVAQAGDRPAFLSRGYGGSLPGPVAVIPSRHLSTQVGDEPLLLARAGLTIVARDRLAGARLAITLGAQAIVMDDGFQNPALVKDLSILVIDAGVGIGNGYVFPAGPLRAPLDPQLARAQAVLIVGEGEAGAAFGAMAQARGLAVFHGRLAAEASAAAHLLGVRVLAFAGIGRPRKFFDTLERIGARVEHSIAFPDHHAYRPDDARRVLAEARKLGLVPVTTEKDMMRLKGHPEIDLLAENALALPVQLVIEERAALADLVARALRRTD